MPSNAYWFLIYYVNSIHFYYFTFTSIFSFYRNNFKVLVMPIFYIFSKMKENFISIKCFRFSKISFFFFFADKIHRIWPNQIKLKWNFGFSILLSFVFEFLLKYLKSSLKWFVFSSNRIIKQNDKNKKGLLGQSEEIYQSFFEMNF